MIDPGIRHSAVALAVVIVALFAGGESASGAATRSCPSMKHRVLDYQAYTEIRVRKVSCRKARRLLRRLDSGGPNVDRWTQFGWDWTYTRPKRGGGIIIRGRRGSALIRTRYFTA